MCYELFNDIVLFFLFITQAELGQRDAAIRQLNEQVADVKLAKSQVGCQLSYCTAS